MSDFEFDPQKQDAIRKWLATRIANIHRAITAYDVLDKHGVTLKFSDREEQFSCPFHGRDNKPSARIYPESARGPSHAWCFVCQERWDAISLWKKFTGHSGTFSGLLRDIEQTYGIEVPESPFENAAEFVDSVDLEREKALELLNACEGRLARSKKAFDMDGFLKLSVALDRIRLGMNERKLTSGEAETALRAILSKIGDRVRACPED